MEKIKKIVNEIAQSLERELGVILDQDSEQIASLNAKYGEGALDGARRALETDDAVRFQGLTFMAVDLVDNKKAIFYAEGEDPAAKDLLILLSRAVETAYDGRDLNDERSSFLKNVLLENELPGDIPLKARELKIDYFLSRQVLLLSFGESCDATCTEFIKSHFASSEDCILPVDEHTVVVLASLSKHDEAYIDEASKALIATFEGEGRNVTIGIGLPAEHLKDTASSYRQAALALTVGSIFEEEERIMWYKRLGLGRLIYQLPRTLCEMFLSEVFAPDTYEALDPETLLTIEKFFENNLNGSETSRQLFVHRNTLVYRLDKVQKITGLDLRTFEDAVLFKLASMVYKYLESLQQKDEAQTLDKHW
ncbi:MAG: helix-turn-helix domain-containing protein [Eubacteriales bacterium]|nr:helix-turn-helix domain-containing protein [Clostridiales bacterium]MDY5836254.1 helix-turn-helix domain-containing protein [Eubacteriales bacterium]